MLLTAAACGGGGAGSGGPVTIDVWINGIEQDQGQLMSELVPMFEQANPGIDVNFTIVDWSTANQKILAAAAGGGLPDVMTFYSVDIPGFAEQGLLRPLDDYIDKSQYLTTAMELGAWEGQWYGAPWTLKVRSLAVRTDFAEQAGLDPSNLPQTWDELRTWANELVVREGDQLTRSGFWITVDHPYKTITQWLPMVWSNGGRMFTEDGCAAAFDQPEAVEAAAFLSDLLNVDKVDFAGSVEADNVDFGQGKVAMLISNIPVRGWERDFPDLAAKEVVAFNPTPHTAGNKSYSEVGGNYLAVAQNSDAPEAAAKFVEFATTNSEAATAAAALDQDVVPLKSAKDSEYTTSHPNVQRFAEIIEATGAGEPKHPEWIEIQNTVTAALTRIYLEQADPAKTLADAAAKVNAIVDKSGVCAEEAPNR